MDRKKKALRTSLLIAFGGYATPLPAGLIVRVYLQWLGRPVIGWDGILWAFLYFPVPAVVWSIPYLILACLAYRAIIRERQVGGFMAAFFGGLVFTAIFFAAVFQTPGWPEGLAFLIFLPRLLGSLWGLTAGAMFVGLAIRWAWLRLRASSKNRLDVGGGHPRSAARYYSDISPRS